jgi:nitrate/nitrite transporter NarK
LEHINTSTTEKHNIFEILDKKTVKKFNTKRINGNHRTWVFFKYQTFVFGCFIMFNNGEVEIYLIDYSYPKNKKECYVCFEIIGGKTRLLGFVLQNQYFINSY